MAVSEQAAWLLNLGQGFFAAIGHGHLVHLLPEAERQTIPRSPLYCRQVILWQGQILPVMDLASRLQQREAATDHSLLGITAFQLGPEHPVRYGSLQLMEPPKRISVRNDQATALPAEWQAWRRLCHSCFKHPQHGAIPILNLPAIFAPPTGDAA